MDVLPGRTDGEALLLLPGYGNADVAGEPSVHILLMCRLSLRMKDDITTNIYCCARHYPDGTCRFRSVPTSAVCRRLSPVNCTPTCRRRRCQHRPAFFGSPGFQFVNSRASSFKTNLFALFYPLSMTCSSVIRYSPEAHKHPLRLVGYVISSGTIH